MSEHEDFVILSTGIEGAPKSLGRLGFEYVPAVVQSKGRQLQILVRMQGTRPDKPHDVWYVIQIIKQSHRGVLFAPKTREHHGGGESWVFTTKTKVKVMFYSRTDSVAATPRIWTAADNAVHFNVWNTMGTLDNIPMIIDEREYLAVTEAVEAYNQQFSTIDPEEVAQL
jgi:hypothetical protein